MPPPSYPPSGSGAPLDGRRSSNSHPAPPRDATHRPLPNHLHSTGPTRSPHVQPRQEMPPPPPPPLMPQFGVAANPAPLPAHQHFVNPSNPLASYDPSLALYNLGSSHTPFVFEDPSFGQAALPGPSYTTGAYAAPSPWPPSLPVLTPPSHTTKLRGDERSPASPPLPSSSAKTKSSASASSPQLQSWTCHWVEEPGGPECGKVFTRSYDLTRHQMTLRHATQAELMGLTEGGEEPVKKKRKKPGTGDFICLDCQIGFSRRDSLQRHCRTRDHRPAP